MYPIKNFFIVLKQVTVGNKYYYAWLGFLGLLIFVGVVYYFNQLQNGLIVTAMRDQVSWGFYISNFTFLVGLAAAAVLLVIPAYVYNFKPIKEIALFGELLAVAAFEDGKEAQAFPAFGSERMGSPVVAFTRYSDRKIRTRTQIEQPYDDRPVSKLSNRFDIGVEVRLLVRRAIRLVEEELRPV